MPHEEMPNEITLEDLMSWLDQPAAVLPSPVEEDDADPRMEIGDDPTENPVVDLRGMVETLCDLRRRSAEAAEAVHMARLAWEREHLALLAEESLAKAAVADIDKALRAEAEAWFRTSGEKHPAPGIEIKLLTTLLYDQQTALNWCVKHEMCLTIDTKRFEKYAKGNPDLLPGIVTVGKAPQCNIATDLGKALASVEGQEVAP